MNALRKLPLLLASASPRRRELLALLLDDFELTSADLDERQRAGEEPEAYVQRMAREKAQAVHQPGRLVLAADTVVVLDSECLGKPASAREAAGMLERLSGRAHEVFSAVALLDAEGRLSAAISRTRVEFDAFPAAWVAHYVASGEPMDKAGAYGIQGEAGMWVKSIAGSYSGVVGLPLRETAQLLASAGLLAWQRAGAAG